MEETNNTGAWFNKDNWRDMRLIFNPQELPPEGFIRAQPSYETNYQKYDEETEQWVHDSEAEEHAIKEAEITRIKNEIAERDYRALKAFKLETPLDELYPGETNWYKASIARINELEESL